MYGQLESQLLPGMNTDKGKQPVPKRHAQTGGLLAQHRLIVVHEHRFRRDRLPRRDHHDYGPAWLSGTAPAAGPASRHKSG